MKNFTFLLFSLLPFFAFGQSQTSIGVYTSPNFTHRTNSLIDDQGKLGYDFGLELTAPLGEGRLHWLAGLQFSTFGNKYVQDELRWGTQHNGEGGFDPNNPGGELLTGIKFRHTYFYLTAPLGLRYYLSQGKVKFFVQPTVAPALFLTQRTDIRSKYADLPDGLQSFSDINGNLRTFNLHAGLGAGAEFPLTGKARLLLMPQAGIQAFSATNDSTCGSRLFSAGMKLGLVFGW